MLFVETYYIIFDIFYTVSSIIINCNIFTFFSIKRAYNNLALTMTYNTKQYNMAYFRCCAVLRHARTICLKPFFKYAMTSHAECLWKVCCMPQHGFSMASTMKRHSVDVIFLCKLEKPEKYFPINWDIIIECIHKHYIKYKSKNTESLCNI